MAGPTRVVFWDGAVFLTVVVLNFGLLLLLWWRARRPARAAGAAGR